MEEKNLSKDNLISIGILAVFFSFMIIMWVKPYNYLEEEKFSSQYPVGSDAYMEDSLAYAHPEWSYERICEELYGREVE